MFALFIGWISIQRECQCKPSSWHVQRGAGGTGVPWVMVVAKLNPLYFLCMHYDGDKVIHPPECLPLPRRARDLLRCGPPASGSGRGQQQR